MLDKYPNALLFLSLLEILIGVWTVGKGLTIILCYLLLGDIVCQSDGQKIFCAPRQILNLRFCSKRDQLNTWIENKLAKVSNDIQKENATQILFVCHVCQDSGISLKLTTSTAHLLWLTIVVVFIHTLIHIHHKQKIPKQSVQQTRLLLAVFDLLSQSFCSWFLYIFCNHFYLIFATYCT